MLMLPILKDIVADYHYVADRYFPDASRQNKNLGRQTRSRPYTMAFDLTGYQRCNRSIENDLQIQLEKRAHNIFLFNDWKLFRKLGGYC